MVEINGWLSIPDAFGAALFARAGWDSVTLDAQHGLFDERALRDVLHALAAPAPRRYVRVPWNDPALVGRALDLGADGVIAPMINSVAEAQALARAAWYPPRGQRSFGPGLSALRAGGRPYVDYAGETTIWAMIETREALAAVEAIAAVDGIDGLFVGPNDLALSLGLGVGSNREEPQMMDAFGRIVAAARGAGKRSGIYCTNGPYARRMGEFGFTMVTAAGDAALLAAAAAKVVEDVRG
ncbi:MAG TPA: aldolase/citrate lyase family protein [Caulobacteraceae bacterium]|jgi:4-hydroxy-2-oxoheptanedioate aldolase|nr:aldolase/citrate lyase family protein [Caulobacteraceae bacterium]